MTFKSKDFELLKANLTILEHALTNPINTEEDLAKATKALEECAVQSNYLYLKALDLVKNHLLKPQFIKHN